MNLPARFEAPSLQHWFGTDEFGRDLLSRVMYGGRVSLVVGVSAVALGGTLGTVLGMVAGYYGRWVDQLVMRSMDTLYAFPAVLLAIGIIGALGPGEENLIIAVAVTSVPIFARIGRASVLEVRDLDYVAMGPLLGGGSLATLRRHVFPNAIGPVIVVASLQVASAILSASALSYLGLGIQPPTPEWGSMLADAQTYITSAPWLSIFPGLAVMAAVMGFNLLGDALRDVLDPRMAKR
jgi:peptide/nickel transport system permease protein